MTMLHIRRADNTNSIMVDLDSLLTSWSLCMQLQTWQVQSQSADVYRGRYQMKLNSMSVADGMLNTRGSFQVVAVGAVPVQCQAADSLCHSMTFRH